MGLNETPYPCVANVPVAAVHVPVPVALYAIVFAPTATHRVWANEKANPRTGPVIGAVRAVHVTPFNEYAKLTPPTVVPPITHKSCVDDH